MGRLLIQALYLGYDLNSRWTGEINPCGFREKKKIFVINIHLGEDSSLSFPSKPPAHLKDSAASLDLRVGGVGGGVGLFPQGVGGSPDRRCRAAEGHSGGA